MTSQCGYLLDRIAAMPCERAYHRRPRKSKPKSMKLSPRELEVAKLLAVGHTNPEVSKTCAISLKTVEKHREAINKKLKVHGPSQLTIEAIRQGIIPVPQ